MRRPEGRWSPWAALAPGPRSVASPLPSWAPSALTCGHYYQGYRQQHNFGNQGLLLLDGSGDEAAHEEALARDVDDDHGDGRDQGAGHDQGLVEEEAPFELRQPGHERAHRVVL